MKKALFPLAIVFVALLSAFSVRSSLQWRIAEGYSIKFTSNDPTGVFTSLKGTILFDENDLAGSKFDVSVDVNSINTGNGMKNKHAKSEKWFDAAKYPNITFRSSKISAVAKGYEAVGMMEIHGIKKEFTMPFTFVNNTFASSFDINRLDYKVGTTEGMSAKVPATLKVDISVPVQK